MLNVRGKRLIQPYTNMTGFRRSQFAKAHALYQGFAFSNLIRV